MTPALTEHQLDALANAVARRVLEQLAATHDAEPALIDAATVAARYGVTRGWVYEHASRLGAIRLGNGKRPRYRFSPENVEAALADREAEQPATPQRRSPRRRHQRDATHTPSGAPLLAVKGGAT